MFSSFKLMRKYLLPVREELSAFVVYGLAFALLNLLVPLIVQLLVNNVALTGLTNSLFTLSVGLLLGLGLLQFCRYTQIILLEYLERKLVVRLTPRFAPTRGKDRPMYFELMAIPKAFSKWALEGFEILLTLIVGTLILMVYHPYFSMLTLLVWGSLYGVFLLGKPGLATAVDESKEKYLIWEELQSARSGVSSQDWLRSRDSHFKIVRRQILLLMGVQVVGSVALLSGGAYLFSINELSIGQFVASELIGGSIFIALSKLAKYMDTHYALVTNFVKIDHALERDQHAS